jgi:HEAT repeat protein
MGFYNLPKEERQKTVIQIYDDLLAAVKKDDASVLIRYFSDSDTFIRKAAYQSIGKHFTQDPNLRGTIALILEKLLLMEPHHIRQTAVNAAGEIGMKDFGSVEHLFNKGLFDKHHVVRNAVIGSIKKMSEKNPVPILQWAKQYLQHPDTEIRRQICHGIELRGRVHPEDILPLLKELQFDTTARVQSTLIHVLGQISYKKGCLAKVIRHLKSWENKKLTAKAIKEIINVHERYKNFAVLTVAQAKKFIDDSFC